MGGVCSAGANKSATSDSELTKTKMKLKTVGSFGKRKKKAEEFHSGESTTSSPRYSADAKKVSFLERAGVAGLERAVEVLDALGSGVTNISSGGFTSGMTTKGNKISVLAFEVANTITKAASLVQSLSKENVHHLKQEVLQSEGVRNLVSSDIKVLLSIAAADKREELRVISREVVRFGDLCKDPQWHLLDRFFAKLDFENAVQKPVREEAELKMRELVTWAEYTSELYHESNALDRFDHDYQQKLDEMKSLHLSPKGETLTMLHTELRQQKKLVWNLRKKSLWSKKMEEVIEKLVDIVAFIHHEISEAFGLNGITNALEQPDKDPERLGAAGLALHYATMINQIDNIACRPTCLPPNTRDSLYRGLPSSVKTALLSSLRKQENQEELSAPQIKGEMEKILQWIVPMAANTTKMHQGFGCVGEWASTSNEFGKKTASAGNLVRLQTLYHAEKKKADSYILHLVTWLHRLISTVKHRDYGFKPLGLQTSTHKDMMSHSAARKRVPSADNGRESVKVELSEEERALLDRVRRRGRAPGISRSQEFARSQRRETRKGVSSSRSMGTSPFRVLNTREHLDSMDGLEIAF